MRSAIYNSLKKKIKLKQIITSRMIDLSDKSPTPTRRKKKVSLSAIKLTDPPLTNVFNKSAGRKAPLSFGTNIDLV